MPVQTLEERRETTNTGTQTVGQERLRHRPDSWERRKSTNAVTRNVMWGTVRGEDRRIHKCCCRDVRREPIPKRLDPDTRERTEAA
jgi:hypothetical protein